MEHGLSRRTTLLLAAFGFGEHIDDAFASTFLGNCLLRLFSFFIRLHLTLSHVRLPKLLGELAQFSGLPCGKLEASYRRHGADAA
jgi:hypothetical protein